MDDILRGLVTGKESERRCTQVCLLAFLNNKDDMDSSWGDGEVGALLKMRIDGCSWEQIQAVLGPGHSIAQLYYKHAEVSEQLKDAGSHPVHCAHSWATRYNMLNGFHIPFLTGGDWGEDDFVPELVGNLDINTPYNDCGGLLSVGAPTPALRSHLVRTGRLSGGAIPRVPFQAQPQESGQGANTGPAGSNAPATGTSSERPHVEVDMEKMRQIHHEITEAKLKLWYAQRQLSHYLEVNTHLRRHNTVLTRTLQQSNKALRDVAHRLRESTESLADSNSKLKISTEILSNYHHYNLLVQAPTAGFPHNNNNNNNNVNSGFHFVAEDSSDPNAPLPNPAQNGQYDEGFLDPFGPNVAAVMDPARLQGYPDGRQGRTAPKPHPVETMYMARVTAERWRHCPWSQGGTLPVPEDMPAPDLSVEEMVQLQKFVAEYDAALRGGWDGTGVPDPRGHRAHGNKKASKKAKRGKSSRKHHRKEEKTVTIAASDSSSSEESDSDWASAKDDNHGEGPSSSSAQPSGHHFTDQPQSQQQQPTATSSSPDYWIHVLGNMFPPRRCFVPDSAWSPADCWILAVIEAKYDALRYKQYQADFFNATGRMVPADIIRGKMARDACPLAPSSSVAANVAVGEGEDEAEDEIFEDANDISSPSPSSEDDSASSAAPTEASDNSD